MIYTFITSIKLGIQSVLYISDIRVREWLILRIRACSMRAMDDSYIFELLPIEKGAVGKS